ncbi:hypothetical protein C8R42DRAFT_723312 [Lentinula raphanica]|nr:hypothetical protein C8R42DRAFT_723312 [Lentinula raphanica]
MPEHYFSSYNLLDALAQAAAELNDYPTIHHHNEFTGMRASSVDSLPEVTELVHSEYLLILRKEKVIKTRGGKPSKTEKVPPKMVGPVDIPVNSSYQQFLEIIRAGIKGRDTHFPLQNESNFNYVISKVKARKGNQEKVVYLEMAPPLQVQQQDEHLPWESNTTITGHHESTVLVLNQAGGDEDPPATEDEC